MKTTLLSRPWFLQARFAHAAKALQTAFLLLLMVLSFSGHAQEKLFQQPAKPVQLQPKQMSPALVKQIESLMTEKALRTPAQQKINSQILFEYKMLGGKAITAEVSTLKTGIVKDAAGRIKVDIKGEVTPQVLSALRAMGAEIVFSSEKYQNIVANIPLDKVEQAAGLEAIQHIGYWRAPILSSGLPVGMDNFKTPAFAGAITSNAVSDRIPLTKNKNSLFNVKHLPGFEQRAVNVRKQLSGALNKLKVNGKNAYIGSVTSEGDVAHKADVARAVFGVNGAGIKVGVISDSYDVRLDGSHAADDIASGDLPGPGNPFGFTTPVTVLKDYPDVDPLTGIPYGGDEGRAMLQIIHDLAPGAQLFVSTAFVSEPDFAQQILDLRTAGCDIIVDDVSYFDEAVYQDGMVAQAVNSVTASGALYFSSAGNSGNKTDGTSGTWEGDFADGGTTVGGFTAPAGTAFHAFSPGINYNPITATTGPIILQWSDALGHSANDYDLYVVNNALTSIAVASEDIQNGSQDPIEQLYYNVPAGYSILILKSSGAARALSLTTGRGQIAINTFGVTSGHNAAATAYTVAATPAVAPGPFPKAFNASNVSETFTSDGPRKIFYDPNGNAITPNNFLFATNGGITLQKPDITAADGGKTTLIASSGLNPFYGTSAAAPHAAAIAALLKSKFPAMTPAQVHTILINSAIDIEAPGVDRNTGAGIVMAYEALVAAGASSVASYIDAGTITTTEGAGSNGNGHLDPGEAGAITAQLKNLAPGTPAPAVSAVLTTSTPGVTITQGNASYGNIAGLGSAINTASPFLFTISSSVTCGTIINFSLTVTYGGGGASPKTFTFTASTGTQAVGTISATLGSASPTGAGYTSSAGTQSGRVNRTNITSTCSVLNTGVFNTGAGTGLRAYHAYTFTNAGTGAQCVTVTMNSADGGGLFTVIYNNAGFVPATPATNYLAAPANSFTSQVCSFNAPAGQSFTVVVHEVNAATEIGATYTLDVSLAACSSSIVPLTSFFVNDNSTTGDVFTTAVGNDANPGTAAAPFATIQRAVSVAAAGNTIHVDAGSYTEQVEITKGLTIVGAGTAKTSIVSPATLSLPFVTSATNKAIVYAHDATGIVIDSLTVDGAGKGNANTKFSGIAYRNAGGTVQAVAVTGIRNTPLDGGQSGYGIFAQADNGTAQTVNIVNDTIADFQKNGIYLSGVNLTAVVSGNKITGSGPIDLNVQNGIVLLNSAAGSISNNTVSSISYTQATNVACGILVLGTPANIAASGNIVNNVQAGIVYSGVSGSITGNKINYTTTDVFFAGIDVEAGTFSVTANEISGNGKVAGIEADVSAGGTTTLTAANNKIANSTEGVALTTDGGNGVLNSTINNNSITGSVTKAIHNYTTTNSAATCNWFGSASPSAVTPFIEGPVTYSPFLNSGTDTDPAAVGFQPAAGTCTATLICESPASQPYIANITNGNQAHRGELGLEFTVNKPEGIIIKQLGAFDDAGNGITGSQPGGGVRVAIFNMATLSIVPGLDATIIGFADAYTGNHRMKNITPVTLLPGNYMLVAKGYNATELNGNLGISGGAYPAGDNGGGAISFRDEAAYGPDAPAGFAYPTVAGTFGSNHQFLAGTFSFVTSGACTTPVPDASLLNLVINPGTLAPSFAAATTSYTASVSNAVASINVTPTAAVAGATIKVNGSAVTSGSPIAVALATGPNTINVVVTATDGVTIKTYTLVVTRAPGGSCESAPVQPYTASNTNGTQAFQGEIGMEFIVNNPAGIIVNQLGAFDDGGNGITGTQSGGVRVAIFNRATHTIVPGLDYIISGSADAFTGNHRMKIISPITLPPGDYTIVAKGYSAAERNGNIFAGGGPFPDGNNGGGAITFGNQSSYGADNVSGFSYPSTEGNFGSTHVFQAGTFNFTTSISCGVSTCESGPAQAYTTNNATGNQAFQGELGMQFIVNNPAGINIKQLGAFDDGANGITGTQNGGVRVAIFNRSTHTIVPGLDAIVSGTADEYTGFHRMKNIAPVTLLPGDYVVVAKGFGATERNGNIFNGGGPFITGDNGGGAISFGGQSSYGPDNTSGFNYPSTEGNFGSNHVFVAGTFDFTVNINCPSGKATTSAVTLNSESKAAPDAALPAETKAVKVYPNPSRGKFNLQLTNVTAPKIKIDIINASGQLIAQRTVTVLSRTALLNVEFNLLNQTAGVYLIKVQSSDGVKTEKLVIQR